LVDWRIASGLSFDPCGEAIGVFVEGVASDLASFDQIEPVAFTRGRKDDGLPYEKKSWEILSHGRSWPLLPILNIGVVNRLKTQTCLPCCAVPDGPKEHSNAVLP